jgi:hypothetical protein
MVLLCGYASGSTSAGNSPPNMVTLKLMTIKPLRYMEWLQLPDQSDVDMIQEALQEVLVASVGLGGLIGLRPYEELLENPHDRGVVAQVLPQRQFLLEFLVGAVTPLPVRFRLGFAKQFLLAVDRGVPRFIGLSPPWSGHESAPVPARLAVSPLLYCA